MQNSVSKVKGPQCGVSKCMNSKLKPRSCVSGETEQKWLSSSKGLAVHLSPSVLSKFVLRFPSVTLLGL